MGPLLLKFIRSVCRFPNLSSTQYTNSILAKKEADTAAVAQVLLRLPPIWKQGHLLELITKCKKMKQKHNKGVFTRYYAGHLMPKSVRLVLKQLERKWASRGTDNYRILRSKIYAKCLHNSWKEERS
ncbi:hypothetical protein CTI12_AA562420 [Artemisia annua]|uniref:Uncharacterized protein n=1 Tax=Artemisia annua TaxID=35608 RepID=A0A2U1KUM7_ARTAN|nr:hypothetical protein CTI12_AA562420 [Artemisia annua]